VCLAEVTKKIRMGGERGRPMLRSRRLGRLMNLRRIPLTLGAAVGAAFAAALIGLANAPAAKSRH
jgi:hypothetical protein